MSTLSLNARQFFVDLSPCCLCYFLNLVLVKHEISPGFAYIVFFIGGRTTGRENRKRLRFPCAPASLGLLYPVRLLC